MQKLILLCLTTLALAVAAPVLAGLSPETSCEAGKNQVVGKYLACRAGADAKAARKGEAADYSRCDARFLDKWEKAESKGGGACPDVIVSVEPLRAYLAAQTDEVASILAGASAVPVCGDGEVNAIGELCDGADLDGTDCTALSHGGGTLACDGSCRFDVSGCTE